MARKASTRSSASKSKTSRSKDARTRSAADPLAPYRARRRFDRTPEPKGRTRRRAGNLYTIQKHASRTMHYDLRLELDGVLKSWAVTRGPSLDPADKRLAVRTEDHPLDYATFEGRIPEGSYGAGTVLLWDRGTWEPLEDPFDGLNKGKLVFRLNGERLHGRWALVRFKGKGSDRRDNWLLVKEDDDKVDRRRDITSEHVTSVASGRGMDEIAASSEAEWTSDGKTSENPKKSTSGRRSQKRQPGKLPNFVEPALATLVDNAPSGKGWLFEVKFDGYRAITAVSGDRMRIFTRNGLDWTGRFSSIADALTRLDLDGALLDGEVVAIDAAGRSGFARLQQALTKGDTGLSYFVFDLLAERGKSLRSEPLRERKARLRALLKDAGRVGPIFFTDHIERDSTEMLATLCRNGYEGIIAKRADAPYRSGRRRTWLKIKCGRDQEFVIVGWSPSTKNRPFSSLLLAVHEKGELRYAGRVGAGFSEDDLATLAKRLNKLSRKTPPMTGDIPRAIARQARWVKPELVAQVAFAEFTREGLVRQGRFVGLRKDKSARRVHRETAQPVEETEEMAEDDDAALIAGIRLTHPDRVLFQQQGVTKRDLATYFEAAAERMLPHVADRLVSLVRCPQGHTKQCFFQRHGGAGFPKEFRRLSVREKGGEKDEYLYIENTAGLVAAAQMGVLELHIWGSRIDDIERPDRLVFDLDPDPAVEFETVKEAAIHMRDVLDALGLQSFALLTGGKGIHVVVPLVRRHEWPTVKAFAKAVAERVVEADRDHYVAAMSKAKRKGRIFIDYFRNERSASAIAPYSPRAREGAPLAWPIDWDELKSVRTASQFRLGEADLHATDGWRDYGAARQSLKVAHLRALGLQAE